MEQLRAICRNPWCKATFIYNESDMITVDSGKKDNGSVEVEKIEPAVCSKCRSFDKELSGGVEWKDKEYEGSRMDSTPHQIKYKVTNFKL